MFLFGGVIAAWGAYGAVMDDPAYAVDGPRPGIVGDLLAGAAAAVDGVPPRPPAAPGGSATVDRGPAGTDVVRERERERVSPGAARTRAPARERLDSAVRVPPGDLSAAVAPVRTVVDRSAGTAVAGAVEAVAPVTRPVVGAAAPVVQEILGAGPLEPVYAVVRPAADPVVETLAPVLAPVLGVTRPILGQPSDPVVPPGASVDPQPGASAVTPKQPEATLPAPCWRVTVQRSSGGEPAAGTATDMSRGRGRPSGTGTGGLTPISSGSAASSASSGAGASTAADSSPRPWTPQLLSGRCASSRCDRFAQRSPQPGTRPA